MTSKRLRYNIKLLREDYFEDSQVWKVLTQVLSWVPKDVEGNTNETKKKRSHK
jgi:hypothetical protein